MGYAIIEYHNERHPTVHIGFSTDSEAVIWAGEHLTPGSWDFATTTQEKWER